MSTGGAESAAAAAMASEAYLAGDAVREARELVAELCRHFYLQGWVTGTGGSITVKANDPAVPLAQQLIVMSPSGVQKERMVAEDMYVMSAEGKVISAPVAKPWPHKHPKCSDCAPLFMKSYLMRGAGAVIHSHGMETCIATMINPGAKEFRMTHMETIKGIKGHGYTDELVIPIIENTPYEYELTDSLAEAIAAYPKATAVLVRNHGIYVWGDSWINAKTQAECYHYLFDAAIKMYQLGLDWTTPEHGPLNSAKRLRSVASSWVPNGCHTAKSSKHCVVLDIEGTTTPISFVTDVMFPYARDNVRKHLTSTYDSEETKEDIKLLRIQVEEDLRTGIAGATPVAPDDAGKEEVISSLVANVEAMIKADRKITSLKQLQGHIWRTGFERKELQGVVFEDVPEAPKNWQSQGMKVYIYSSGSREAQRLLFGHTSYGDLRQFLCGFFDTTTGNKREARSYFEISQSLGVDNPSQILFITDVFQEAVAAKSADKKPPHGHTFPPGGGGEDKSKLAKTRWVEYAILDWVRETPTVGPTSLHGKLFEKYKINIPYMKIFYVKEMSLDRINGPWNESFQLLFTFKAEVETASPGSGVEIDKHTVQYKLKGKTVEKECFCLFQVLLAGVSEWL